MSKMKLGKFKVVVCGGRDFNNYDLLEQKLDFFLANLEKDKVEILSGCAKGADTLAIRYAEKRGYKVYRFPPDWNHYPSDIAPLIRNTLMAQSASHCIAFWNKRSTGTKDMIQKAKQEGLEIKIVYYDLEGE